MHFSARRISCTFVGIHIIFVAQLDILEAIRVVPDLVPPKDLFADFAELKAVLPKVLAEIGATE